MEISPQDSAYFQEIFNKSQNPDLAKDYAVELPGSQCPGYSSVYRNKYAIDQNHGELIDLLDPRLDTSFKYWQNAVQLWPKKNCLGHRPLINGKYGDYVYESYEQIDARKTAVGSGIMELVLSCADYQADPALKEIYYDYGENPEQDRSKFIVAIFSTNRPEWVITDLACQAFSLCSTTLYDNLDSATCKYILTLMKCPIIFVSKDKILQILSLKKNFKKELNMLKIVVCFDKLGENDHFFHKLAQAADIELYDFANLESLGTLNPRPLNPPNVKSPYTVCFTSGTTGVSKGVYISQQNIATSLTFTFHHWPRPVDENSIAGDSQLRAYCLLPLAHIYERQTTAYWIVSCVAVGFPTGNISKRVDDCSVLKPHFMQAVPRIYNKIEQELKTLVKNNKFLSDFIALKFRYYLGDYKFDSSQRELEFKQLDLTITNKLRQFQGFDCVKLCLSASAPISLLTENYICTVLNVGFIQNYGASEVTSACTGEYPYRQRVSNTNMLFVDGKKSIVSCSGVIGVTTDIKLRDLPDLGYVHDSKDGKPRGEVMFCGPQVFEKYVFQPELTKDSFVIDKDGRRWYKTGDICEIDSEGKLFVIDRVKNFFKLSQGEFLSPERIENIYLNNIGFLNQCFVHGFSDQDFIIAIVGVVPKELAKTLEAVTKSSHSGEVNIDSTILGKLKDVIIKLEQFESLFTPDQVLKNQEVELDTQQSELLTSSLNTINSDIRLKKILIYQMNRTVAKNPTVSLSSYEYIKNVYFDYFPLKIRTGLLTPTLKLQRPTAIKTYKEIVNGLYEEGSLAPKPSRL